MTNYVKYAEILKCLVDKKSQSEIITICKCSYSTITSSKNWWLKYHDVLPVNKKIIDIFLTKYIYDLKKDTTTTKKVVVKKTVVKKNNSSKKPEIPNSLTSVSSIKRTEAFSCGQCLYAKPVVFGSVSLRLLGYINEVLSGNRIAMTSNDYIISNIRYMINNKKTKKEIADFLK